MVRTCATTGLACRDCATGAIEPMAKDRLREWARSSPTEARIKVEVAERMVARAQKRLAAETD